MKARAESQAETRRRIVEAAMQLHEEIGPRATTISAIAERAGVQRLTVYRHFADEAAVFAACTSHWISLNPLPEPSLWEDEPDPRRRFRRALAAFYAYYARTHRMWDRSSRDLPDVPALQEPVAVFEARVITLADGLAAAFRPTTAAARRAVRATARHALAFSTWADLQTQGLSDRVKVDLVAAWMAAAAGEDVA